MGGNSLSDTRDECVCNQLCGKNYLLTGGGGDGAGGDHDAENGLTS